MRQALLAVVFLTACEDVQRADSIEYGTTSADCDESLSVVVPLQRHAVASSYTVGVQGRWLWAAHRREATGDVVVDCHVGETVVVQWVAPGGDDG